MKLQQIAITAAVLLLFATIGTLLVALTYEGTRAQIAANEREALLRKLNVLVPPERYDNAIFEDTLQVTGAPLLGSMEPVMVYRARHGGELIGCVSHDLHGRRQLFAIAGLGIEGLVELPRVADLVPIHAPQVLRIDLVLHQLSRLALDLPGSAAGRLRNELF